VINVQNVLQKKTWTKKLEKWKQKWELVCTMVSLRPPKLEMLVKTQYVGIFYDH